MRFEEGPDGVVGVEVAGRLVNAPGRIRTCDLGFRKALLYPLSYGGALFLHSTAKVGRKPGCPGSRAVAGWTPPPRGGGRDGVVAACHYERQAACFRGSHWPPAALLATLCVMKFMPSTPSYTFG